jgi:hypothetical protein
MPEEYDNESTFSPFYPLLILLIGLTCWCGYQVIISNSQRSQLNQQFQSAIPTLNQAQNIKDRYVALMKDLIETSSKDANAAAIVKEATQAGLLRVTPPAAGADAGATNGGAPAAPADGSAPAK